MPPGVEDAEPGPPGVENSEESLKPEPTKKKEGRFFEIFILFNFFIIYHLLCSKNTNTVYGVIFRDQLYFNISVVEGLTNFLT